MTDISELLNIAFTRDYNIYSVTFVKNRRIKSLYYGKNIGSALSMFKKFKRRYKSIKYRMSPPLYDKIMDNVIKSNPFLSKLRSEGFTGNAFAIPIAYKPPRR